MEYRILGKTGLKISAVGFGGIPIQRISDKDAADVIKRAEELGINFIDSAHGYTVSEEYIGRALKGRRDKWIIATKSPSRESDSIRKDIETSFKNLAVDYIDLFQFHNVRTMEDYNKVLAEGGAYDVLMEYKSKGKIGHIGITSHSLDILKIAVESGKFETIMYPYNIIENQGEEVFKRAHELNIGVMAMKPLAGGAIEDGRLAVKFILHNENVTCALPGMARVKEVEENAAVSQKNIVITEEEKAKMQKIAKELGTDFCRRCGYCAPCTMKIDIPGIFVLQGYKERYGLSKWAEDRYFKSEFRAKDCIECGKCEERCPYSLPIRSMMKKVRKCFNE